FIRILAKRLLFTKGYLGLFGQDQSSILLHFRFDRHRSFYLRLVPNHRLVGLIGRCGSRHRVLRSSGFWRRREQSDLFFDLFLDLGGDISMLSQEGLARVTTLTDLVLSEAQPSTALIHD